MESTLGMAVTVVAVYLGLAAVGIINVALFRQRTADYLNLLRRKERKVVVYGLVAILLIVIVVVPLHMTTRDIPADNPVPMGALLLYVLILLLVWLVLALGYGAVAWHIGERVLRVFGVAEPLPGWSVLVGSLLIIVVFWVPVLGWALTLYSLASAIGVVILRALGGAVPEPNLVSQQENLEEPSR
ncbi:MAG: hypothetical protein RMJ83_00545 [Armatimonadota bacterium]|nr:hypothetical protein [Armatimonadota bacterium]